MEWLNLHVSKLDSPEFLGSEPMDRATWVCLQRFCAGQENAGRIEDCHDWKDRKWQQLVGVTEYEAKRSCDLWRWDGDDLVLWGYDRQKEADIIAKREGGRKGGKAKTQAKIEAAKENGKDGGRPKTQAKPKLKTQAKPKENPTEGKGREGKVREEEEEGKGREREGKPSPDGAAAPPNFGSGQTKNSLADGFERFLAAAGVTVVTGAVDPQALHLARDRAPLFLDAQNLDRLCEHARAWRRNRDKAEATKGKRFRPLTALMAVEEIDSMFASCTRPAGITDHPQAAEKIDKAAYEKRLAEKLGQPTEKAKPDEVPKLIEKLKKEIGP